MPFMGSATRARQPCGRSLPGISEALITTAAGLFAAIPAVIAYNYFMQEVRQFGARMDDFSLEMLNTVERGLRRRPPNPTLVERR